VTALSAEWHEAVANHMLGPNLTFPPLWYPAATIGDYDIVPIYNSTALYREGATMHHWLADMPMMYTAAGYTSIRYVEQARELQHFHWNAGPRPQRYAKFAAHVTRSQTSKSLRR
jgi:hypothetical protein